LTQDDSSHVPRAPRVTRRTLLGGALAAGAGLAIPDVVRAAGLTHAVTAPSGSRSCDVVVVGAGLAGLGVPFAIDVALWLLAGLQLVTVTQRLLAVRRSAWEREAR